MFDKQTQRTNAASVFVRLSFYGVCFFRSYNRARISEACLQIKILADGTYLFCTFLDATAHLYKRSCPSVRRSVRPYVPRYFRTTNMAAFEDKKSSNDIIINDTMSDDEIVASDVPPRYLLTLSVLHHSS